jgi:fatty-acyl-CoA synthase
MKGYVPRTDLDSLVAGGSEASRGGAFARHLRAAAAACPDRDAIVQGECVLSWREFEVEATRLAASLHQRGVGPGSRVGICCYNCPEYLIALFALFILRAVPVNLNYRYRSAELSYVLGNCGAVGLIHAAELGGVVDDALAELPACAVRVGVDLTNGGFTLPPLPSTADPSDGRGEADPDEWLLYTGGTTGLPRAVVGSQQERLSVLYRHGLAAIGWTGEPEPRVETVIAQQYENGIAPVYFAVAPLMHGTGLYCALIGLALGGTVVLAASRSFDPHEVARVIAARKVTDLHIVGEAVALPLVEALEEGQRTAAPYDVKSLARVQSSGMVWTARTKRRLLAHVDAELTDLIAATEGGPFAISQTSRRRPPADDTPFVLAPGARVLRQDGTDVTPGSGEVGVLAAPTSLTAHYLGDPERTAANYREVDGQRYVALGDLAAVASDGTVAFLGRGSSVINSGGEKVFPDEVETVLRRHPSVRDVAVAGVHDRRFGELVGAVVVPGDQGVDADDLAGFVARSLSGYKKPRIIVSVPEIRRLASGKTDLGWIREQLAAHAALGGKVPIE